MKETNISSTWVGKKRGKRKSENSRKLLVKVVLLHQLLVQDILMNFLLKEAMLQRKRKQKEREGKVPYLLAGKQPMML